MAVGTAASASVAQAGPAAVVAWPASVGACVAVGSSAVGTASFAGSAYREGTAVLARPYHPLSRLVLAACKVDERFVSVVPGMLLGLRDCPSYSVGMSVVQGTLPWSYRPAVP